MISDEMVEKAAAGIDPVLFGADQLAAHYRASPIDLEYARNTCRKTARAAIEAVAPDIRAAALEEAANVADEEANAWREARDVADAIRALIPAPPQPAG
jgi:hypothetical protein